MICSSGKIFKLPQQRELEIPGEGRGSKTLKGLCKATLEIARVLK